MNKIKLVLLGLTFLSTQVAQAYPGFSRAPKSESKLTIADNESIVEVVSGLYQTKSFELETKDRYSHEKVKVNIVFMESRGAVEADPEIPSHLISVRNVNGDSDDEAYIYLVKNMFIDSVKVVSFNRLHIEGTGGSAHGCHQTRQFDIELTSEPNINGSHLEYVLKYMDVVDTKSGDNCSSYE